MNKNILYITDTNFPLGYAGAQKNRLVAKGLVDAGCHVEVLVMGPTEKKGNVLINNKQTGTYHGIKYSVFPRLTYPYLKYNSKISVYINKLILYVFKNIGLVKIVNYIIMQNGIRKINSILIYTLRFKELVLITVLSKILKIKSGFFIVEDLSTFTFKNPFRRINNWLYMNYSFYFPDIIFPISNYLKNKVELFNQSKGLNKKCIIYPVIYDNIYNKMLKRHKSEKYFLYNGTASYLSDAFFLIESISKLNFKNYKLYLIIGNISEIQKEKLKSYSKSMGILDKMIVKGWVSDKELVRLYQNASGLLIPLPNTDRSKARFPQKMANYLITGNPMITNIVGEVKYYFEDKKNALISKHYNTFEFAENIQFVIENPQKAKIIGKNGKETAIKYFNLKNNTNNIIDIL